MELSWQYNKKPNVQFNYKEPMKGIGPSTAATCRLTLTQLQEGFQMSSTTAYGVHKLTVYNHPAIFSHEGKTKM